MAAASPQVTHLMNVFTNASEEHVVEIINALKALPQCVKVSEEATKMSTTNGVKKSRSKKTRAKQEKGNGPKRPLNSWMAYRKFYNQMLSPRTQKVKSKILTLLWKADPFEAKWSILAKSYSILRGNREKEEVSLDIFLDFCTPRIGVVPPSIYLGVMGWELGDPNDGDQTGEPIVTRTITPDVDSFPSALTTTTLSVDDLVKHCIDANLFSAEVNNAVNNQQMGSLTMAVQPWTSADTATVVENPTADASPLPMGVESAQVGLLELENLGEDADIAIFDPASGIDTSWDPSEFDTRYNDGGIWDSFNLDDDVVTGVLASQDVDFASFLNTEHIL